MDSDRPPEGRDEAPAEEGADAAPDLQSLFADRDRFLQRFVLSLILAPPPGRRPFRR